MREEYDANPQDFQDNSMKGVHARFYWFPYKDEAASAEAGRPIFQDREFVELLAPGNSTNIVRRSSRRSTNSSRIWRWNRKLWVDSFLGLSLLPKPIRSGTTTRHPDCRNTGIILRYK